MKFTFGKGTLETSNTDLLLIEAPQTKKDDDTWKARLIANDGGAMLDKKLEGLLSKIIDKDEFSGEEGSFKLVYTLDKLPSRAILTMGIGKTSELTLESIRRFGAKAAEQANKIKAKSISAVLQPEKVKGFTPQERLKAFVEGVLLGMYEFNTFKSKKDNGKKTLEEVRIFGIKSNAQLENAIATGTLEADAQNWTRELVNTPANTLTPADLAKTAENLAKEEGLKCTVFGPAELKKERMNLILAVGRGSENHPALIHLTYMPKKKAKKKIAIVGKGITFDSGGYNLKPGKHIENMKDDMAGAATVLATMRVIARLEPQVQVDAYIPAAENMIGSAAQRPGDIVTARNGKTIELINMDAEGRLILADALDYAVGHKPDVVVDIATLTGGVLYALGELYAAILGNDQKLIDRILKISQTTGELHWQLPLVKEYKEGYKGGAADLRNIGKTGASTISGALFLQEFVGDTNWAHLDIAESAWTDETRPYRPKGATGSGVRTMIEWILSY